MLEHLGAGEAAAAIVEGIETVLADGSVRTRDMGGTAGTREMAAAIEAAVRGVG
jgi:tartrate dehydrogenase/decarboxylase/D-malate dehydrogenase